MATHYKKGELRYYANTHTSVGANSAGKLVYINPDGTEGDPVGEGATGVTPQPPLVLTVASNGQTVWNIGGNETRNVLYINGVRYKLGTDYTISLPNLTWTSSLFSITTTDELLLTQ